MKLLIYILILGLLVSCNNKGVNNVTFDSSFKGARLDSIEFLGNDTYKGHVNPSFEPVNQSPWFAFTVSTGTW